MTDDNKQLKEITKGLNEVCGKGFLVGTTWEMPSIRVSGQYFHFPADQMRFLYALSKTQGDVKESSKAAGWPDGKAERFFLSAKWRAYREKVLAAGSIRNGDLRDEWWEFMLDGMAGMRCWYEGQCELCYQDYKLRPSVAEQYRTDDMKLEMTCGLCRTAVALTYREEDFKPSREQVQCAVEVGNRVEPKTERVSHTFSEETFSFVMDGQAE